MMMTLFLLLAAFQLRQLTQVDGRVLEAPRQLLTPIRIEWWVVVNFLACCDTSHLSRELINCGRNKGIHIERPHTLIEEDPQYTTSSPLVRVEKMFELITAKLPRPPEFLLCVLAERKNSDIYEHSSRIPLIKDTPTMILGMDVSHGSPGRSDIPSIAAVVGSCSWPLISRYRAALRTQSSKVEMIESLYKPLANGKDDGIMRELLVEFYKTSNGRKPASLQKKGGRKAAYLLPVYPFWALLDGVSESQFNQVLNNELDQIIKAYQHLGEVGIPMFTVIVAQKNHHTKLFQASAPENVPPGTVVDTKVVHPRNYDFYMCTQAGMIGTSRPAHYHVLLDEIGFSPDDL
ncbi:hypothetical protein TEA_023116 [Camellia sinensis var. sinensis]|uniref:Piwi domain-containing protein n=1 Tax=Camellia sinensis var. sinensis TaxID=542762 RepID=A0A4S4E480_CAMSN|nr:hypothetical protein TEA_023116 [Camellia sinensis var. sinensis]